MKILFFVSALIFSTITFADVVTSRKAFAFTQNGEQKSHSVYADETANPAIREAQLLQATTREINGGFTNLIGIETVYKDGYLTQVKITRLVDVKGPGNLIRVAIATKTFPGGIFEDTAERYLYATTVIPREDLLAHAVIEDPLAKDDGPVAHEVFYREPSAKAGLQQAAFAPPPKK